MKCNIATKILEYYKIKIEKKTLTTDLIFFMRHFVAYPLLGLRVNEQVLRIFTNLTLNFR